MQTLLCLSCGHFVTAITEDNGDPTPVRDDCPQCGGTAFEDVATEQSSKASPE